jgi:hypothetical protein
MKASTRGRKSLVRIGAAFAALTLVVGIGSAALADGGKHGHHRHWHHHHPHGFFSLQFGTPTYYLPRGYHYYPPPRYYHPPPAYYVPGPSLQFVVPLSKRH